MKFMSVEVKLIRVYNISYFVGEQTFKIFGKRLVRTWKNITGSLIITVGGEGEGQ